MGSGASREAAARLSDDLRACDLGVCARHAGLRRARDPGSAAQKTGRRRWCTASSPRCCRCGAAPAPRSWRSCSTWCWPPASSASSPRLHRRAAAFKGIDAAPHGRLFPFSRHHRLRRLQRFHGCGRGTTRSRSHGRRTANGGLGAMLCRLRGADRARHRDDRQPRCAPAAPSTARASGIHRRGAGARAPLFATVFGRWRSRLRVRPSTSPRVSAVILQELFAGAAGPGRARHLATSARRSVPAERRPPRPAKPPTYMAFWTLFGTRTSCWPAHAGERDGVAQATGPSVVVHLGAMLFVLVVTVWRCCSRRTRAHAPADAPAPW